ncbi:TPA: hypothetical protein QEL15_000119 [Stenotrophomonas maltophilia]|nr:hypothetical protein [Stenotrophomonas maltophilia]
MAASIRSARRVALSFALIASCIPAAVSAMAREPRPVVLVRLSPAASAVLATGLLRGVLKPINGCVYFVDQTGTAYLAAWPYGYSLALDGGTPIGIQGAGSGQVLKFGVAASFGGGHAAELPRSSLATNIPSGCSGPMMTLHLIRQNEP